MSDTTTARFRTAIIAVAPAVVLAAFLYHPYVATPTDAADIGAAATADTTRWGLAHLALGVGFGLAALAFVAVRSYLHEAGEDRWSVRALPFMVFGNALFAILPGMEFAPLAAAEAGTDAGAAQAELRSWFIPILLASGVSVALGALGFALGIIRSGVLSPLLTRLVVGALGVMAVARFVPLGAAQYVIGVAGIAALWPLAYVMWTGPAAHAAGQRGPMPA